MTNSVASARLAVAENEARWNGYGATYVQVKEPYLLLIRTTKDGCKYRLCKGKSSTSLSREAAIELLQEEK